MKDFKLMSEADDSYHVQHKNGKTFTIEKKGLSEKAHGVIKKMACGGPVKMADGGDVPEWARNKTPLANDIPQTLAANDSYGSTSVDVPMPFEDMKGVGREAMDKLDQPYVPPEVKEKIAASKSAEPGQIQGASTDVSSMSMGDPLARQALDTGSLLDQQAKDARDLRQGLSGAGVESNKAYQDFINQQSQMKNPAQIAEEYRAKDDDLLKHIMDSKVDPNRYMHNMSTGSRILAGIAMLLSGAGAGANGKNMAYESLQKAIDNDIDAQKNDQSHKMNLWKMNRENMRDEQQTYLATKNQMLTALQAKIAMMGASTQNMESRFRATQAIHQVDQERIQNRFKLSLLTGGGQAGGLSQADPALLVQQMVKPEHQKEVAGEIDNAKTIAQNRGKILKAFDEASKDVGLKSMAGYEPGSVGKLKQMILPLFKDIDSTVRQAAMDETFHNVVPKAIDGIGNRVPQRRQALEAWLDSKAQGSLAKSYGIDLQKFAPTSSDPVMHLNPQERSYYNWAVSHPGTPKAQDVFKRLGISP